MDLPHDLKELYQNFGIDLPRYNGDNSWKLPVPSRFITDQDGFVIDSEVNPDYTVRPDPEQILEILDGI